MERFWLKHYPAGVPADIDPSQYRSIAHLIEESLRKYATRTAYVSMGKPLTFRELDDLSRSFGAWLQQADARMNRHKLAIAFANKLARIAWSVLRHGREFDAQLADTPAI